MGQYRPPGEGGKAGEENLSDSLSQNFCAPCRSRMANRPDGVDIYESDDFFLRSAECDGRCASAIGHLRFSLFIDGFR